MALDSLFAQYTMERESAVHGELLRRFGLASRVTVNHSQAEETDDGVLLF
jgi:hypothetical protein